MAYETISNAVYGTVSTAEIRAPRPMPQSPDALGDLGRASTEYAGAAAAFIEARANLDDARSHWNECRDKVAKLTEVEGVA